MQGQQQNLRAPPHSEEAERGVLGSIMLDPETVLHMATADGATGDWFYEPRHRSLFELMVQMQRDGRPIDILTVTDRVRTLGCADAIGGEAYIERLVDGTPTAAHARYYLEQVREKLILRGALNAAREMMEWVYSGQIPASDVVSKGMIHLQRLGERVLSESRTNGQVLQQLLQNWERALATRESGGEYLPGLRTPYHRYNEIMGGLQPGLHFFGGKSSSGKTALVLNLCRYWLLELQAPGLMIQLDDTHEDVIGRMVAMIAGSSLPALAQGFGKRATLEKIKTEVAPLMEAMGLYVEEECESIQQARAMARYYVARHNIQWLVIDYVQVLDCEGAGRGDDERQRLGKIATICKLMWKELRIPVLVVSQTAKYKDAEDDGRKADMSDLFGASELFHAGTSVCIIKHVRERLDRALIPIEMPIDSTGHTKKVAVAGHITKNKHGPRNTAVMFWALLKYFRFEETKMIQDGGIWRQRTWEEEVEDNARALRVAADKPGWAQ